MTPRENLLIALSGGKAERRPFVMPGGLVASCVRDGRRAGLYSAEGIAALSSAIRGKYGVDNSGIPCVMTLESEAYGAEIEGNGEYEYPLKSVERWRELAPLDLLNDGRFSIAFDALRLIKRNDPDAVLFGDMILPPGLASSLVDGRALLKAMAANPDEARGILDFLASNSARYLKRLVDAGADVIFMVDPFSTAKTLGPELFEKFTLPYANLFASIARGFGLPSVLHICGDAAGLSTSLSGLRVSCVSVDAQTSIGGIRAILPEGIVVMGGLAHPGGAVTGAPEIAAVSCGQALDLSADI